MRYRPLLEKIEDGAWDVENVHLDAREEELSAQLCFGLVLAMPEDSVFEMMARGSAQGESAECWRKLVEEHSPAEA